MCQYPFDNSLSPFIFIFYSYSLSQASLLHSFLFRLSSLIISTVFLAVVRGMTTYSRGGAVCLCPPCGPPAFIVWFSFILSIIYSFVQDGCRPVGSLNFLASEVVKLGSGQA